MNEFLDPNKILKELKLQESMIAADFGSGSGGWVIPLAKTLEDGKVYAIDILEEPISALNVKIRTEKLFNIQTIQSNIEGERSSTLLDSSCDLVLMTNLLFQCENKEKVLEEGKRVLKSGGKILIVDWKKDALLGPKDGRIYINDIKKLGKLAGLKLEKEFEAGTYHWGLILVK